MKPLSRLRLLSFAALLLAAGLPAAHAQSRLRVPGEPPAAAPVSAATLSTNYRLTLAAKSGEKALGQISLLTCARTIDASGMLDKPADEALPAAMLSLRGTLTEEEGGALLLNYTFGLSTPVVSKTMTSAMGASAKRAEPDAKAAADANANENASAKPEPPRAASTSLISYRDSASSGALRMKPGSTYELVTMAGVVYSLTLVPEPLK
ncbi:hypothetical protein [Prosthecobacter sp.]|uniref:hypothetical protein n=1 Tax=Prosthecobacter sp. TaxID=1965333 RepID=UPI003782DE07